MVKKENLVLIHGWGASTTKLKPLTSELKKLGWQVFTPELPGFDKPAPKKVWDLGDYTDFVIKKSKKFYNGKRFFLFGHSFGGRIAIKAAIKCPKPLAGIILCSTSGLSRPSLIKRIFFYILAKMGKLLLIVPPAAGFWKKVLYKLAGEHDYKKTKGVMRDVFKKVISEDLRPFIGRINIPTLVLWGKLDRTVSISDAYYLEKVLSKAKLVVFEREGHRLPYNKPKELAQEIDKWVQELH